MGVSNCLGTWGSICFLGTWRGDFFTGDPEGYVKEGSGNRHLS